MSPTSQHIFFAFKPSLLPNLELPISEVLMASAVEIMLVLCFSYCNSSIIFLKFVISVSTIPWAFQFLKLCSYRDSFIINLYLKMDYLHTHFSVILAKLWKILGQIHMFNLLYLIRSQSNCLLNFKPQFSEMFRSAS